MPGEEKKDAEGNVIIETGNKGKEQWIDPGSQEGVKKDPRVEQNKLTPDTPRFQDIYKEMKQGQEKIAELEKKIEVGSGNTALVEEMRKHNQALEKTIQGISEKNSSETADTTVKDLETKLTEFKELKKAAREKADFESETDIDEKMADLRVDIRDAKKAKAAPKTPEKKESEISDDDTAEYELWKADNPWFTKEPKKKAYAILVEKKIVKEPEFADSTITEVLEEVGKRVEEKFKPVEGVNAVEAGEHKGSNRIPGTVKVSPVEMELAKGFGISPERWAKQKSMIAGGNK